MAWPERNTAQTVAVSKARSRNRHFVTGLTLVGADFVNAGCHAEAGRSLSSSLGALVFRLSGGAALSARSCCVSRNVLCLTRDPIIPAQRAQEVL